MNIDRIRKNAKALVKAHAAGDPKAIAAARSVIGEGEPLTLSKAQLLVARNHGFRSWAVMVASDDAGQTSLVRASQRGDAAELGRLLRRIQPLTPLLAAICWNRPAGDDEGIAACIQLLLEAGCNPNAGVESKGQLHTCLAGCITHGYGPKAIATLIAAGADPSHTSVLDARAASSSLTP